MLAMAEDELDVLKRDARLVVWHYRDFPRLKPSLLPLILPIDLGLVSQALILAATCIC
jgi:hypothetical protein